MTLDMNRVADPQNRRIGKRKAERECCKHSAPRGTVLDQRTIQRLRYHVQAPMGNPPSVHLPRREPSGIARLELLINENRYKVLPTSAGSIAEVRSFRLRKADGTIHIVSETLEGCTCTCLDYVKVRSIKGSHCKHLLAAFAVGLLDGQKGGAK